MASDPRESDDMAAWRAMAARWGELRALTPGDASSGDDAATNARIAGGIPDDANGPGRAEPTPLRPRAKRTTRPATTHVPAVRIVPDTPPEIAPEDGAEVVIDADPCEQPTDRLTSIPPDPRIVALSRAVRASVHPASTYTPRAVGQGVGAEGMKLHPDAWDAGSAWGWQCARLDSVLEAGTQLLELARYFADQTLAQLEPMASAQMIALRDKLTVSYIIAYAYRVLRASERDPLLPWHPTGHPGIL